MKISNSKRIALLVTVSFLTTSSFAVGLRPLSETKGAEKVQQGSYETAVKLSAVKYLNNSALSTLSAATIDAYGKAIGTNKTFESTLNNVRGNLVTNPNPVVVDIAKARIQLTSYFGEVDIFSEKTTREMQTDAEKSAAYYILRISNEINPMTLGNQGQENVAHFLKSIQEGLDVHGNATKALSDALEKMEIDKGFTFDMNDIAGAFKTREGVTNLFKGDSDVQEFAVGTIGNTPLNIRMTRQQAEKLEVEVQNQLNTLIELAQNPNFHHETAKTSLKGLSEQMDSVNRFIKDNPILDRGSNDKLSKMLENEDAGKSLVNSLDQLLSNLNELGTVVNADGVRQKSARWIREYIPFAQKVITDPAAWKMTLKQKISEIDKSIVRGAEQLDQNNNTLINLRSKAVEQTLDLQKQMAKSRLVSDHLQEFVKMNKDSRPELVKTIESQVVPQVERELNSAMALYGILKGSIEAIDHLVANNLQIITDAYHLRNVAAPAIAITESVKIAGQDAKAAMVRHKKISKFVEQQMQEMSNQVKTNNEMFAKMAGDSVISPEVLDKVLTDLIRERESMTKRMVEAGKRLRANNVKLAETLNKHSEQLSDSTVGLGVNKIINNGRGN